MKISILPCIFLLLSIHGCLFSANAQGPVKAWDNIYRGNVYENFTKVIETYDHNLVVAGSSSSGIGGDKTQDNHDTSYITFDFWIVKTNTNGNLIWEKSFGGNYSEELIDIKETDDHGFILAGTTMSDSSGDVSQVSRGLKDYWILKTDSLGNIEWEKRFGGNQTELLYCVIQTLDGGYVLGGTSLSNASGDKTNDNHNIAVLNFDYWIVKTDSSGNKIWDKTIGGDNYDIMQAICELPSGDLLLGGYSKSDISGDKTDISRGEADFWLLRTNSNGIIMWDKTYGGDNIDWLFSMTLSHDGGIVMAGTSGSTDSSGERTAPKRGGWDYWIVKADTSGNKLWDQAYGGIADEEVGNIIQTKDHGFLISGTSYSPISGEKTEDNFGIEQGWMVKSDSAGAIQWDRTVFTYGHDESGYSIQTFEGCYVTGVYTEADTGGYKTHPNFLASDYWILKFCYETPGVSFISSDTVFCAKKCIDFYDLSTNNPTSWYWSFPGAVPSFSTDQNPTNICYNAYGQFDVKLIASNAFGSDSLTVSNLIVEYLLSPPTVTVNGDTLFCSPAYSYQWYFDTIPIPGATNSSLVMDQPGSYSVIISDSLGCLQTSDLFTTAISENIQDIAFRVFPNPSKGKFTLTVMSKKKEDLTLRIFNIHGELVENLWVPNASGLVHVKLDLGLFPAGVYLLKLNSKSYSQTMKVLLK